MQATNDEPIRALLIEDNAADAMLVRGTLNRPVTVRFNLVHVVRLAEGMGRLRDEPFDVVLLDLGLPDSEGLDTFTRIREQSRRIPVVVLSGLEDESVAVKALQEGAQQYLPKDAMRKMLVRAIHSGTSGEAMAPNRAPALEPPSGRLLKVLLVEDNADSLRILARALKSLGHTVNTAASIRAALDAARQGFDLLISDIGLPDGTGWELIRRLSGSQAVNGIALSGFGTDEDVQRSKDAGFLVHLIKPVSLQKLEETLLQVSARMTSPDLSPECEPSRWATTA